METLSNMIEVKRAFFSNFKNVYWRNSKVSNFVMLFRTRQRTDQEDSSSITTPMLDSSLLK